MVALLSLLGVMTTLVVTRLFGHAEFLLIKVRFWSALAEVAARAITKMDDK